MTNKTISLTIPNDDPIALHEFGAAMQRMAGRHGLEQATPTEQRFETLKAEMGEPLARGIVYGPDTSDKAQLAALGEALTPVTATGEALDALTHIPVITEEERAALRDTTPSHLDSDGLPWDARIHASSKERNADDTWRARRKPSDMDADQWAEFQGQVRTELRALMAVPVDAMTPITATGEALDVLVEIPVISEEERAALRDTPVVVEPVEPEPIVVTPPPVVAPPAPVEPVLPVAPPAPTGTAPTEFVPFLQWITSSGITPEQVNVALAQHGLTAVPQLQQRPDLIPQVHATLAAGV